MSRIVTDWVLELGDSKAGLEDLIKTVDQYNTTVSKAAQSGKVGFSQLAQQQQQVNQQLVVAVQNQSAVNKAVDAGVGVVNKAVDAEKQLGKATTETSDKAKQALDQNIARQQQLTQEINASAAASERVAAGGTQVLSPVPRSTAPVAPATAVIGAVPSPAVAAVSAEFERQITLAADASKAAQAYLQTVSDGAAAAKTLAAGANAEAKQTKALYDANRVALAKVEEQVFELETALSKSEPGKQQDKVIAALEKALALEIRIKEATVESKQAYQEAAAVAESANAGLEEKIALQTRAKQLVKETADAEKGLQVAAKLAIAAANDEARATGLIGGAEAKLTEAITRRKLAQTKPELTAINQEIAGLEKEIAAYKKLGQTEAAPSGGGFFSSLIGQIGIAAAGFFTLQKRISFLPMG